MIRYALKCTDEHEFESWFASAQAFDGLKGAGMVTCPVCGSDIVEKMLMAPRVQPSRSRAAVPAPVPAPTPSPTTSKPDQIKAPEPQVEAALRELRKQVEANSDYVGLSFAAEARKMHLGDIPHRSIYGEAKPDEARQLLEDGIPVAPLPFIPNRKTN
jgi:hypothetical protein